VSHRVRSSEEKFRGTFNQAAVGLAHVALDGSWLQVNDKLCEILGYSREEITKFRFQDVTHPDDLNSDLNLAEMTAAGKIPNYSIEKRYLHKDKHYIWANLTVSLVRDEKGEPDYFISVVEDISVRKKVEQEMEEIQIRLEQLVEERTLEKTKVQQELLSFFTISKDAMIVLDDNGYIRRMNKYFVDLMGFSEQELLSRPLPSFLHLDDLFEGNTLIAKILETDGHFTDFESRYLSKDGEVKYISWNSTRMPETSYSLLIGRDATEQRRQEQIIAEEKAQLASASRLNSLGRMAANIAHEINNPLTVIYGQACQMTEMFSQGNFDPEKLKKISLDMQEMSRRISTIIRGLRLFAREGSQDPMERRKVRDLIFDTLPFCLTQLKSADVELDVEEIQSDVYVNCRSVQISQVLLNLINNSFDALQHQQEKRITIKTIVDRGWVKILVIDNGPGVDASTEANLFESFFTTKPLGKGTGLGLNISRQIVESHRGKIFFKPYNGSTSFVVELPIAP
jgi:PAS domain S-box-containing protein